MKQRVSPTFIAAGVVIGLSCFVLLSMLFYDTTDYYERAGQASAADGLRFSVASAFFTSLGIGAYLGWAIILAWGIIVFFRENVGDLALRGASLVVVVVSGAALASLLGADQHGGNLGIAVGSILEAGLGSTFGAMIMLAIFAASFLYATDYGFFRYVRQAREAIAVLEEGEDEIVAEEEELPDDWSRLIDRAAIEVEEEPVSQTEAAIPEEPQVESELLTAEEETSEEDGAVEEGVRDDLPEEADADEETSASVDGEPLVLNFRSPIEEEDLDEDLLVTETPDATRTPDPAPDRVTVTMPETQAEIETPEPTPELDAEPPPMPEAEEPKIEIEEDLLLNDEVADIARQMLEALEPEESTKSPEPLIREEPAPKPEIPDWEEEEDTAPDMLIETPAIEEVVEAPVEEPTPEPEPETAAPAAIGGNGHGESAPTETVPIPGDVDSVFDALLGPAPTNGTEPAPAAEEPIERPIFDEPFQEEPGFVLMDDTIIVGETEVEEEPPAVEEPAAEEPAVEETAVEEAAPEAPTREEAEEAIVEEIATEVTGEVFVEQVILVDDRLDGSEVEEDEEAPLLPFMAEEEPRVEAESETPVQSEPAEEETAEPESSDEIPVLEDVSEPKKKVGVLRSLFGKKSTLGSRPGDPLLDEAALLVIEKGRASVVFLQRRLDIGYTRASRLIDAMERQGLVGPLEESGSREVLMAVEEWEATRA